jgi:AbrB family looped-hinge helix DNA binding protein
VADRETLEVTVGPQGRLVIPASLRRRLSIEPGEVLIARAEEDRLVLERRKAILARLRERLRVVPTDVSLVDELIAERRKEAEREERA